MPHADHSQLKTNLKKAAIEIGFQQCGIASTQITEHIDRYRNWIRQNYHGDMTYMASRESIRSDPTQLVDDTLSVISVRLNYVPQPARFLSSLADGHKANISRYALGRDYHKLMRKKLAKLASHLKDVSEKINFRVFVDSAPILERAYAENAGLGWIGKNSMLINEHEGSFFFIGEILTNLPLEPDEKPANQCGSCTSCINFCPTQAIIEPYVVDARKCISYLTIEHFGSIPEKLRPLMGNRIYGCDDCQLVCPWNRYAKTTNVKDFSARHNLDHIELLDLYRWSEKEFLSKMEGSPIRRIGYERWIRNISIALGNAPFSPQIIQTLRSRLEETSSLMVKEHIQWAIDQQIQKQKENSQNIDVISAKQHAKLLRTTQKLLGHLD